MKTLLTIAFLFISIVLPAQTQLERLQQAEKLYLEGLQAENDNDRAKATDSWNQAAAIYSELLDTDGFDNAKLRYNLANVCLAQKKLGLAIHNYKIALELEPDNERIAANLDVARSLRKDNLTAAEKDLVLKTLFFFHYDISFDTRRIIFYCFYTILFLAIIIRIFTHRHVALTTIIAITACCSIVLAVSLGISWKARNKTIGVITAKVVHAKVGSSNSYQDAFDTPLHDGTEFMLIETDSSNQWLHVRLDNGSEGWIPADTALLAKH